MYDMILYAHEHDKNIPLSPLTIEILKVCLLFVSGVNKNFPLTGWFFIAVILLDFIDMKVPI